MDNGKVKHVARVLTIIAVCALTVISSTCPAIVNCILSESESALVCPILILALGFHRRFQQSAARSASYRTTN